MNSESIIDNEFVAVVANHGDKLYVDADNSFMDLDNKSRVPLNLPYTTPYVLLTDVELTALPEAIVRERVNGFALEYQGLGYSKLSTDKLTITETIKE